MCRPARLDFERHRAADLQFADVGLVDIEL
jgi:hypothetical protein